jgi:hypothetical protein
VAFWLNSRFWHGFHEEEALIVAFYGNCGGFIRTPPLIVAFYGNGEVF